MKAEPSQTPPDKLPFPADEATASLALPQDEDAAPDELVVDAELEAIAPFWKRWRTTFLIVGLTTFAATILIVLNVGEVEAFAAQAAKARPAWLAAAITVQIATYVCGATVWWLVLQRLRHARSLPSLVPLSVAKLFVDQAMPSAGVSGSLLVVRGLGRRGVPRRIAFTAFLVGVASYVTAFVAAALCGLALLALNRHATLAVVIPVVAFLAVFLALAAVVIFVASTPGAMAPRWLMRLPAAARAMRGIVAGARRLSSEKPLLAQASSIQMLLRVFDGLTLWICFQAIGAEVPYWACFVAIVMGSLSATVIPTPMGLGSFEGGTVATLALLGVPAETALTTTLLFRGLSLWLPLIPGYIVAQRELYPRARGRDVPQPAHP